MLSVKDSMGCLSCIAQMCFEVTQKYGAIMVENLKDLDHVYEKLLTNDQEGVHGLDGIMGCYSCFVCTCF